MGTREDVVKQWLCLEWAVVDWLLLPPRHCLTGLSFISLVLRTASSKDALQVLGSSNL